VSLWWTHRWGYGWFIVYFVGELWVNFLVSFVGGTWVWFYGIIVPYSKMNLARWLHMQ
jgi:hypothetical protein